MNLLLKLKNLKANSTKKLSATFLQAKALIESAKHELTRSCEGLTTTQAEKIKSLAESVEFSTEEEYTEKLETIRENYFPSGVKESRSKTTSRNGRRS
jgi:F0F1-type ATP synthase membrane subunit b/b'